MRIVLDTNVVVSGLLWSGRPARLLDLLRAGQASAFTSEALLDELAGVLSRRRLAAVLLDAVLACALAAGAELIVSGDKHLRNLKFYQRIPIVSPADALAKIDPAGNSGVRETRRC